MLVEVDVFNCRIRFNIDPMEAEKLRKRLGVSPEASIREAAIDYEVGEILMGRDRCPKDCSQVAKEIAENAYGLVASYEVLRTDIPCERYLAVTVTDDEYRELVKLAEKRNTSIQEIIREALENYLRGGQQ